ncbi:hypothetical protein [Psychromarinibacter halotolerans]|uniref:Uncharacterized protein n=1 Tax=Psychromarinibacter halotolerans TaxID=1775175 RepID=A0ABV7GSC9_9RHOB|nr:hypothetical protein [Psychromarinibacter halotolerans]MDF0596870.1 hypothetical protein [Psychromarinibacter halotolerans]
MRLIVSLFLVGLVAVITLPEAGMAGSMAHGHDCVTCPEDVNVQGSLDDPAAPACAGMENCTLALLPAAPLVSGNGEPVHLGRVRPDGTPIFSISIRFDLPPPRG